MTTTATEPTPASSPTPPPAAPRSHSGFLISILLLLVIGGMLCSHFGVFNRKPRVALVLGEGSYYDLVLAGANEAARQYDVVITPIRVKGDQQPNALRGLVGQGYDGIAVSPFDPSGEAAILTDLSSKTTLVTFDSDSPLSNRLCFVGTDNYAAGRLCGQQARLAFPDGGEVMILVASLDKENVQHRRQGVIDELLDRPFDPAKAMDPADEAQKGKNYTVAATVIDSAPADETSNAVADALKKHPDVKCLIGLNTASTSKLLKALTPAQLGKLKVIGFDADPQTLDGVESGNVFATILQDQFGCGFHAIRILAENARGDRSGLPMFQRRTLPVEVVTKENVASVRTALKKT